MVDHGSQPMVRPAWAQVKNSQALLNLGAHSNFPYAVHQSYAYKLHAFLAGSMFLQSKIASLLSRFN